MSAAVLSIALFTAYMVVVVVARGLIQRARTGDNGINGYGGAAGPVEGLAGFGSMAANFTIGLFAPLLALLDVVEPIPALDDGTVAALGAAVFALGAAAMFYVQLAMGESWRIGVEPSERTDLVTTGPFGFARNPIYTAMITAGVGLALLVPSWVALAGLLALILFTQMMVRLVEEPHLGGVHGAAYRDYASRVGRFLPGMGRLRSPAGR
jgi:protein-S-isoprenylcysteine O-methyltransferase Ste14